MFGTETGICRWRLLNRQVSQSGIAEFKLGIWHWNLWGRREEKRRAECLVSSKLEWGEFSWLNWKVQLIDADSVTALLPSPTMSSPGYSLSFSIKFQSLCIFATESSNCISLIKIYTLVFRFNAWKIEIWFREFWIGLIILAQKWRV